MDVLQNLGMAFGVAFEPSNILMCFIGVLFGTLVGVLPGLGPTATIALLLPITFNLSPVASVIMLSGVYYGAYYGGTTTSVLVNIPGEAATVVTCLDGYEMAKKGRAGPALGIAAIGSFIGGTFAMILLVLLAPPLASMALEFGPPERAALIFFGLSMVTYLSSGPLLKSLTMAGFGLLLGCIGTDLITGSERFTMGFMGLSDGLGIVPVVMGLFGVTEVLLNVEKSSEKMQVFKARVREMLPTREDWKVSSGPIARGSVLGFFIGLLPGGGGILSSFLSYAVEKRLSRHPERFGTGEIQGVAGPETANNAGAQATFIPLLTLGLPCNATLAVLMGAFMIHGITPGPLLMKDHPALFWGVVGSMYLGNAMLVLLNLPLIPLWVKVLRIPYRIFFPLILLICVIGSYSLQNSVFDVGIMIGCGAIGYLLKKFGYEAAPLVLALVLGPMLEEAVHQSMVISGGSGLVFLSRPIAAALVVVSAVLIVFPLASWALRREKTTVRSGEPKPS